MRTAKPLSMIRIGAHGAPYTNVMNTPCWQQFHHPAVRTLAWARFSPPLVIGFDGQLPSSTNADMAFFHTLDEAPQPLVNHLAQCHSHRLGDYFEALWSFYFQYHPDYRLLAHNLQVQNSENRTLGAFDFIYQYLPTGENHHLEVAVKFYLFIGDKGQVSQQSLWPGPNPKDNLAVKIKHFIGHQLPLSSSAEGMATIATICNAPTVSASALLKGYLFYPWGQTFDRPDWAPPSHCNGRWLHITELQKLVEHYSGSRWIILEKTQWLGGRSCVPAETSYSGKGLYKLLEASLTHYPIMVARLGKNSTLFDEIERFFITPMPWPDIK